MQDKVFISFNSTLSELSTDITPCYSYLRVCCSSMVNEGINSGDILKVNRKKPPASGDIVVAVFGEDMLIRKFLITGNKRFLIPGTDQLSGIELDYFSCKIWGVVESVLRNPLGENSVNC